MAKTQSVIGIPSNRPGGLNASLNPRFGRCPIFTLVILEDDVIKEVDVLENPGQNAMGGAGPMAAQFLAEQEVTIVIGGNYGPNAASALKAAGIEMYGFTTTDLNLKLKNFVQKFIAGELPKITDSNVPMHSGMNMGGRGGGSGGRGGGRGGGSGKFQ